MSSVLTSDEARAFEQRESLKWTGESDVDDIRYRTPSRWQRFCRGLLLRRLQRLTDGQLSLRDSDGLHAFRGRVDPAMRGTIAVKRPRLYSAVAWGGALAAAESYLRGDWLAEDLTTTLRVFARNAEVLAAVDSWGARLMDPWRSLWLWSRRNTRSGSRRNISEHYDLSNEFFELMLDPTMTYSSGIFERANMTLEQASVAKYDRICRKLQLKPTDHVLEIGTGWGGFAMHAARNYGCRVTTTTISREQHLYAQERIEQARLDGRIELLLKDYRDVDGQYDKAVSIEMIEAVGEQMFDTYFRQCCRLLKPDGAMVMQAITMPDDRYDRYRRSVDFINRYVFPGGFLPSFSAIGQSLRRATDFRLVHLEDFAADYARTLACWRANFWNHVDRVRQLGFDQRFVRMWHYYLCYCEAGFAERQIGVSQLMLTRPGCRLRSECF